MEVENGFLPNDPFPLQRISFSTSIILKDIHTRKFNMVTEVMVLDNDNFLSTMSRRHKVVYFEETCQNSMFIIFLGFSPIQMQP